MVMMGFGGSYSILDRLYKSIIVASAWSPSVTCQTVLNERGTVCVRIILGLLQFPTDLTYFVSSYCIILLPVFSIRI